MEKVYVVTAGVYSDYHIVAVFSTRGKAKEYIESYRKHTNRWDKINDIEVYDLDRPLGGLEFVCVLMSKDGKVIDTKRAFDDRAGFGGFDMDNNLYWTVQTNDIEKAIKVTNEKRLAILALGVWGHSWHKVKELIK